MKMDSRPPIFRKLPKALGRIRKTYKEIRKSRRKWEFIEKDKFRKSGLRKKDGFKNNRLMKKLELVDKC